MRTIVFALAGALAITQSVSAADIPRPVANAPVVVAAYNWTGFYVGVHAGYGWADGDVGIGITDPTGIAQGVAAAGGFPVRYSFDHDGYVAGGQIGYNHQMGSWLLGVEADISVTGIDGSQSVVLPACPICAFSNASSASQKMDWFGTVRGRLGFAANNLAVLRHRRIGLRPRQIRLHANQRAVRRHSQHCGKQFERRVRLDRRRRHRIRLGSMVAKG